MRRKIVAIIITAAFLLSEPLGVLAQTYNVDELVSEMEETTRKAANLKLENEEEYQKFTCPSCGRGFEIRMDPNDLELKRGIKKITCPYDGSVFYPPAAAKEEEQVQYEAIRCPNCGREFKGFVDVKAILAGQPQIMTCPYDKKKFYFKAEGVKRVEFTQANLYTVMCPTDRRTFKAYIDQKGSKKLTCPYDGTQFFPSPELILSQGRMSIMDPAVPNNASGATATGATANLENIMQQAGVSPLEGLAPQAPVEEQASRIEQMFSEHIPLSVSTSIKQFGYDVFKPIRTVAKRGQDGQAVTEGSQDNGKNLLKSFISGSGGSKNLFEEETLGDLSLFASPTEIPVISDYILAPGDTLRVSVWGQIQEIFPITVDSEGKVLLPKAGPLYLWGVKFSDAEKLIKENLLKAYTNIEVSVSLGRLRGIKVFVVGEAQRPGAYTISALSNSFHALYAAGGPTKFGSMRNIKLIRKGSAPMPIDAYNMLLSGDNSQDYKLQSNDTIFIPPIGDVIGVAGNVKRPAIYELKEKIRLSDAIIDMAGGFSAVGYLQRIQLERIQEHLRKVVLDLEFKSLSDLKNSPNNLELQDGDLVIVFPITPIRYNFVSISGNVLRPGDYELKQGMRLKDLIDSAGGMLPGTYLKRAEISRFRGDQTRETIAANLTDMMDGREEANLTLKEWDVVTIYARKDVLPNLFVSIDGAVNKPGQYELTENMKISDLVFRAGGMSSNALLPNAELFRSFADNGAKVINIDLDKVLRKDTEEARNKDMVLEEGDHLFVRGDTLRGEKFIINLAGEFKYPGKYAVEKGTHLSAVIERAGGFTDNAFLDGCIYTRESVRIAQQKVLRGFIDAEEKALLQEQSSLAVGLTSEQAESRNKLIAYRKNIMDKMESLQMPGRILMNLRPGFKGSEYDITIENGDTLTIPVYPSTVQVVGNVYGAGTITFSEGKGVDYYINKTGGLTKYADPRRIYIIRASGETVSSFVKAVKIKRGDAIIVPEDFRYRTLPGLMFKDFMQVIYQATLGAAVAIAAINSM